MEAVENALVEGKILWLAQTILEGIFSGKHDEWIRHVGLGEGMEQLKSEIERVETVVAAAKGRATGNKPLARSLARLRELMYDADDLLDEVDYFRLQEQVEKGKLSLLNVQFYKLRNLDVFLELIKLIPSPCWFLMAQVRLLAVTSPSARMAMKQSKWKDPDALARGARIGARDGTILPR
jgi:hypothetical protein